MLVDIHFTFDKEEEFNTFVAKLSGLKIEASVAKPKAEKTKAVEAERPTAVERAESEEKKDALTYEEVKKAVLKVAKEKGKAAALRALAVIGTDKVGPHIKESDYEKLLGACMKEAGA